VVSIEGVDAPEGRACVSALLQVMNSFCTARMQTDRDVLHAPDGCPDVVLVTGPGNSRHCMIRISPGPQDSPFGDAAEVAVLDPSHPEAPLHAAEALAQLPAFAVVLGLRQLSVSRPSTVFRLRTIRIRKQRSGNGSGSSARAEFRPRLAGLPGLRAQARAWWECIGITAGGCLI
jgi:hypothetical protein